MGEIKKKVPKFLALFIGGRKRIRTAVRGFADHCLAARPSDHFQAANIAIKNKIVSFLSKIKSLPNLVERILKHAKNKIQKQKSLPFAKLHTHT